MEKLYHIVLDLKIKLYPWQFRRKTKQLEKKEKKMVRLFLPPSFPPFFPSFHPSIHACMHPSIHPLIFCTIKHKNWKGQLTVWNAISMLSCTRGYFSLLGGPVLMCLNFKHGDTDELYWWSLSYCTAWDNVTVWKHQESHLALLISSIMRAWTLLSVNASSSLYASVHGKPTETEWRVKQGQYIWKISLAWWLWDDIP